MPPRRPKPIEQVVRVPPAVDWRYVARKRGQVDHIIRDQVTVGLVRNVKAYEGDYALHVFGEEQLLLSVRDQDGSVVVYDCIITRRGVVTSESAGTAAPAEPATMKRKPAKDWW